MLNHLKATYSNANAHITPDNVGLMAACSANSVKLRAITSIKPKVTQTVDAPKKAKAEPHYDFVGVAG